VNEIRELKRQGLSINEISGLTGFNRRTVRKYLAGPTQPAPMYGPRVERPSKLDAYKDYIKQRLQNGVWNAAVLLREIKSRGYTGGYSILKDHLHPQRKAARTVAVRRFETPPGHQAQVDWGDVGQIIMEGQTQRLSAFVLTLGHSRVQFAGIATDQTLSTLIQMHERAFAELGGVPQEILYDNMKTVVLGRNDRGEIQWHPVFLDFAKYWGFTPRVCRPHRPQTKGKIEAGIRYLRSSFLSGCTAGDLETLHQDLRQWVWGIANRRLHGTTHQIVFEAWEAEKSHLSPLSGRLPYPYTPKLTRRVSRDAFVSYAGNRYSVPWTAAGLEVSVHVMTGSIEILRGEERLALHPLCNGAHQRIVVSEHHAGIPLATTAPLSLSGKAKINVSDVASDRLPLYAAPVVEVRSLSAYEALATEGQA
jgi:transposase